jgi:hypothetical protein
MSTVNQTKIAAPWAIVDGKSIGQWSQDWLKWVTTANKDHPVGELFGSSPSSDASNGGLNQNGPVFFLFGGNWGVSDPATATVGSEPVINVPAGKDILIPLVNAFDLEDGTMPTSTIQNWTAETHLSYADEARFIPGLASLNIHDAHLSIAMKDDPTHPFLSLKWPVSDLYTANSGVFSLGSFSPDTYLGNLGITDLPFADVAGRWAMLTDLSKGDYIINFGGSTKATYDPFNPAHPVILAAATYNTTDVLHVG